MSAKTSPPAGVPGLCALLIALSLGSVAGRILSVNSWDSQRLEQHMRKDHNQPDRQLQRPFLSGNDRSRWLTVRALVEQGTFAIDDLVCQPNWDTIDMVQHQDPQGNWRLYSSKPPLVPILMAAQYWVLKTATGKTLGTHPYELGRVMLFTWNLLPWWTLLACTLSIVYKLTGCNWTRLCCAVLLCQATLLTPFLTVINNHLHGACTLAITLWVTLRITARTTAQAPVTGGWFQLAGACAALTVVSELPAAAFVALWGLYLLYLSPRQTCLHAAPAVAVVMGLYLGTNYWAHGSPRPPYAHRGIGPRLAQIEASAEAFSSVWKPSLEAGKLPNEAQPLFEQAGQASAVATQIARCKRTTEADVYNVQLQAGQNRFRLHYQAGQVTLRGWDDWYDYEYQCGGKTRESYWRGLEGRAVVDQGEPSQLRYAFHALWGHHGVFSLTPIWILIPLGLLWAWAKPAELVPPAASELSSALQPLAESGRIQAWVQTTRRQWSTAIALLSLVTFAFYMTRPLIDRNYGGTSSALRWMLWLIPAWTISVIPVLESCAQSAGGRRTVYVLLALSALSAHYPTWNPWMHPWLAYFFQYLGWIKL